MIAALLAVALAFNGTSAVRNQPGMIIPSESDKGRLLFYLYAPAVTSYPSGDPSVFGGATNGRTSTATGVRDSDGSLFTGAAGETIVEDDGVLIFGAATNIVLRAEEFDHATAWTRISSAASADSVECPASPRTGLQMDRVTFSGANGVHEQQRSYGAATAKPVTSVWIAARVADGTVTGWVRATCPAAVANSCDCGRSDNGSCTTSITGGDTCWSANTVGTTPIRAWVRANCSLAGLTTIAGISWRGVWDGSNKYVCAFGLQAEADAITSYIPTVATALTRTADTSYVAQSWITTATPNYCVKATVKPYGGDPWNLYNRAIWSVGTDGAANSIKQVATTAGNLTLSHYDNPGALLSFTGAHGMPTVPVLPRGNGRTISGTNRSGLLSERIDGAPVAGASAGAGTGFWGANPTNMYFGSLSSGSQCNCWIKAVGAYAGDCP